MPTHPISGFTLVRNALELDFPIEAAIRSILPLCEELIVNVGASDDDTLDLVRSIADPRIRVIESTWNFERGYRMLADETQRAMEACQHEWGIYIQADEVLHHDGIADLREKLEESRDNPEVEGLLVRYRHFYGTPDYLGTARRWYRHEVRAVRLRSDPPVRSYLDAQGFRVGSEHRKIRVRPTAAWMHHYGWARPDPALVAKARQHPALYAVLPGPVHTVMLPWEPGIRRFEGTHPEAARSWVAERRAELAARVGPRRFRRSDLREYLTFAAERLTGRIPFEFRNYQIV